MLGRKLVAHCKMIKLNRNILIFGHSAKALIYRTYAVPHANRFLPAAAWYLRFYLYFVFALCEHKNEIQKKIKYRSAEGWIADCVSPVI
jgi:hypothetical protein